jgi:lysozyme
MTALRAAKWATLAVFLTACAGVATGCSASEATTTSEQSVNECLGTSSLALKTCAGPTTLRGIDVSYYQGTVDWAKVKAAGQSFAFVRVSDGIDYPDTKFAQNWPAVKNAGLVRGFYQFFRPGKDVQAQVNLLIAKLDAAGGFHPGDLPPVLDLESDGGLSAATVVARAKQWLDLVEATYGVKPIVYTAAFMSNVIGNKFSNYTLWVANYLATCPTMPSGWTDWSFWQDSDKGSVKGVGTPVDTNFFNGSLAELQALTLQAPEPEPPTPTPPVVDRIVDDDKIPQRDQGATMGSSVPSKEEAPQASAPFNPCR